MKQVHLHIDTAGGGSVACVFPNDTTNRWPADGRAEEPADGSCLCVPAVGPFLPFFVGPGLFFTMSSQKGIAYAFLGDYYRSPKYTLRFL